MAAFVRKGGPGTTLVLNHEVSGGEPFPLPPLPGYTFNPAVGGGCTILVVNTRQDRQPVRRHRRDAEQLRRRPHTVGDLADLRGSEATRGGIRHGYVFDVDPHDQEANRDPKPIKALGRFAHESVTVDPRTGVRLRDRGREQPERAVLPLDAARRRRRCRRAR